MRTATAGVLILIPFLLSASVDPGWRREPMVNLEVPPAIAREIQNTITLASDTPASRALAHPAVATATLSHFYRSRGHQPAWFDSYGHPTRTATALIQRLALANDHGLDPRLYANAVLADLDEVTPASSVMDREQAILLAAMDVAFTRAFLSHGSHLSRGRLDPQQIRINWYADDQPVDLVAALQRAVADGDVERELDALAPSAPAYAALRSTLAAYRELALHGGWPMVQGEGELRLGDQGEAVAALRQRLQVTGDLSSVGPASSLASAAAPFDETLAEAVRAFQTRHGLTVTGAVDAETRPALNVPIEERIRTIELNLERWRWLPPSLGDRYLQVNVPAFELEAIEHDQPVLRMRVVVGKPKSQTPVLSDTMTYLVINPFWNVPASIANGEILPQFAADPAKFERENFEIEYDERGRPQVRQRPGAGNALGRIKFIFPNPFNIYLHDTPADHLFARTERDFSHGCVRVEDPLALASYVLRGEPRWTAARITGAIAAGSTIDVRLPEPLPVHVLYWTAWVDGAGRVQFRDDIYGKDRVLDQALRGTGRAPAMAVASG